MVQPVDRVLQINPAQQQPFAVLGDEDDQVVIIEKEKCLSSVLSCGLN